MTHYTFDEAIVSDLYKDVYGTRSMGRGWATMTDDEKQAEWDYLCKQLELQIAQEAIDDAKAIADYEAKLAEFQAMGAGTRERAIEWLVDSIRPEWQFQDAGEVCYYLGLPYKIQGEFEAYIRSHPWKQEG